MFRGTEPERLPAKPTARVATEEPRFQLTENPIDLSETLIIKLRQHVGLAITLESTDEVLRLGFLHHRQWPTDVER